MPVVSIIKIFSLFFS